MPVVEKVDGVPRHPADGADSPHLVRRLEGLSASPSATTRRTHRPRKSGEAGSAARSDPARAAAKQAHLKPSQQQRRTRLRQLDSMHAASAADSLAQDAETSGSEFMSDLGAGVTAPNDAPSARLSGAHATRHRDCTKCPGEHGLLPCDSWYNRYSSDSDTISSGDASLRLQTVGPDGSVPAGEPRGPLESDQSSVGPSDKLAELKAELNALKGLVSTVPMLQQEVATLQAELQRVGDANSAALADAPLADAPLSSPDSDMSYSVDGTGSERRIGRTTGVESLREELEQLRAQVAKLQAGGTIHSATQRQVCPAGPSHARTGLRSHKAYAGEVNKSIESSGGSSASLTSASTAAAAEKRRGCVEERTSGGMLMLHQGQQAQAATQQEWSDFEVNIAMPGLAIEMMDCINGFGLQDGSAPQVLVSPLSLIDWLMRPRLDLDQVMTSSCLTAYIVAVHNAHVGFCEMILGGILEVLEGNQLLGPRINEGERLEQKAVLRVFAGWLKRLLEEEEFAELRGGDEVEGLKDIRSRTCLQVLYIHALKQAGEDVMSHASQDEEMYAMAVQAARLPGNVVPNVHELLGMFIYAVLPSCRHVCAINRARSADLPPFTFRSGEAPPSAASDSGRSVSMESDRPGALAAARDIPRDQSVGSLQGPSEWVTNSIASGAAMADRLPSLKLDLSKANLATRAQDMDAVIMDSYVGSSTIASDTTCDDLDAGAAIHPQVYLDSAGVDIADLALALHEAHPEDGIVAQLSARGGPAAELGSAQRPHPISSPPHSARSLLNSARSCVRGAGIDSARSECEPSARAHEHMRAATDAVAAIPHVFSEPSGPGLALAGPLWQQPNGAAAIGEGAAATTAAMVPLCPPAPAALGGDHAHVRKQLMALQDVLKGAGANVSEGMRGVMAAVENMPGLTEEAKDELKKAFCLTHRAAQDTAKMQYALAQQRNILMSYIQLQMTQGNTQAQMLASALSRGSSRGGSSSSNFRTIVERVARHRCNGGTRPSKPHASTRHTRSLHLQSNRLRSTFGSMGMGMAPGSTGSIYTGQTLPYACAQPSVMGLAPSAMTTMRSQSLSGASAFAGQSTMTSQHGGMLPLHRNASANGSATDLQGTFQHPGAQRGPLPGQRSAHHAAHVSAGGHRGGHRGSVISHKRMFMQGDPSASPFNVPQPAPSQPSATTAQAQGGAEKMQVLQPVHAPRRTSSGSMRRPASSSNQLSFMMNSLPNLTSRTQSSEALPVVERQASAPKVAPPSRRRSLNGSATSHQIANVPHPGSANSDADRQNMSKLAAHALDTLSLGSKQRLPTQVSRSRPKVSTNNKAGSSSVAATAPVKGPSGSSSRASKPVPSLALDSASSIASMLTRIPEETGPSSRGPFQM